jgi:hypothetical protein
MLLNEFFSVNKDATNKDDQVADDLKKDLMGYILDDDEIFKTHLMPLINKIESGKTVEPKDYSDIVKDCCIKFYKEKDMTTDPNEIFPKSMRDDIAKNLLTISKQYHKKTPKDEN